MKSAKPPKSHCIYHGCNKVFNPANKNEAFFQFPSDPRRFQEWVIACQLAEFADKPPTSISKYQRICSHHFDSSGYIRHGDNFFLKLDATPRMFIKHEIVEPIDMDPFFHDEPHSMEDPLSGSSQQYNESSNSNPISSSTMVTIDPLSFLTTKLEDDIVVPPPERKRKTRDQKLINIKKSPDHEEPPLKVPPLRITIPKSSKTKTTPTKATIKQQPTPSPPLPSQSTPVKQQTINLVVPPSKSIQWKLPQSAKNLPVKRQVKIDAPLFKFLNDCDQFLSKNMAYFCRSYVYSKARLKATNLSENFMEKIRRLTLIIYFNNPMAYRQLFKDLSLTNEQGLIKETKTWPNASGLNDKIFEAVRLKMSGMDSDERMCVLCVNHIKLRPNVCFNPTQGCVIGMTADGNDLARSALTVSVNGVKSNWTQHLAYFFFVQEQCPAKNLENILKQCLGKMIGIDMTVVAIIMPDNASFVDAVTAMGVTAEKPAILIGDQQIFVYFDPMHLMATTRDIMMYHQLQAVDMVTQWRYIDALYQLDRKLKVNALSKLTDAHIYPNPMLELDPMMAVHVLSRKVAAYMSAFVDAQRIPLDANNMIEFIMSLNSLFDILNSNAKNHHNGYKRAYYGQEFQLNHLKFMIQLIGRLKIVISTSKRLPRTKINNFIFTWQITMSSLIKMWPICSTKGLDRIFTRRLTLDNTHKMFMQMRRLNANLTDHPTPLQFYRTFEKAVVDSYYSVHKHIRRDDHLDTEFQKIMDQKNEIASDKIETVNDVNFLPDVNDFRFDLPKIGGFSKFANYLLRKCHETHKCAGCSSSVFLHERSPLQLQTNVSSSVSLKKFHTKNFFEMVSKLDNRFHYLFLLNAANYNSIEYVATNMLTNVRILDEACPHFPTEFCIKLFVRARFYQIVRTIKRELRADPQRRLKSMQLLLLS